MFNYYFDGHRYKVQTDNRRIGEKETDGSGSTELRAQMQFSF